MSWHLKVRCESQAYVVHVRPAFSSYGSHSLSQSYSSLKTNCGRSMPWTLNHQISPKLRVPIPCRLAHKAEWCVGPSLHYVECVFFDFAGVSVNVSISQMDLHGFGVNFDTYLDSCCLVCI